VNEVAKESKIVHVDDDRTTNVTFFRNGNAAYFESLNVVVKIDGSKSDLDGVLFSAHFDSVSTAPGATDDGMGVATLLQLVEYFSKNQPKRTVVFNINDGEEDGLYGAQVYVLPPIRFALPLTFESGLSTIHGSTSLHPSSTLKALGQAGACPFHYAH
jgi:acetylornithine deacetylase/succinyl-diaminopimelate desuccinylase-like protein